MTEDDFREKLAGNIVHDPPIVELSNRCKTERAEDHVLGGIRYTISYHDDSVRVFHPIVKGKYAKPQIEIGGDYDAIAVCGEEAFTMSVVLAAAAILYFELLPLLGKEI